MTVFAGTDGLANRSDTWALVLGGTPTWVQLSPSGGPPPGRWCHSAIHDPSGARMIVFGGWDGFPRSDVWALALTDSPEWTPIATSGAAPPARREHVAVCDSVRGNMVVICGFDGSAYYSDAWSLTLTGTPEWTQMSPAGTAPSSRSGTAGALGRARDRIVFFGGGNGLTDLGDTWELLLGESPAWSNTRFQFGRDMHTTILDPPRRRLLLFGGFEGSYRNDLWELRLAGHPVWARLSAQGTPPSPRVQHTAIYDSARERMVVFGGRTSMSTYVNDTYELLLGDTLTWRVLEASGTPPAPRRSHVAVYDPVGDRMIVHGGWDGAARSDTWTLAFGESTVWSQLEPGGVLEPAWYGHSAVYDEGRQRMVVFGGSDAFGYHNQTMALALGAQPAWEMLFASYPRPTIRTFHSAIYDPSRERMVIFAGDDPDSRKNDAWTLPLSGEPIWDQLTMIGGPPSPREWHSATYDPTRDVMVVFGGLAGYDDTWFLEFDPVTDVAGPPVAAPSDRLLLAPPAPNPFTASTRIRFALPAAGLVRLDVFDVSGRLVERLLETHLPAGANEVTWDGRDARGRSVPSGVYLFRLETPGEALTRKVVRF